MLSYLLFFTSNLFILQYLSFIKKFMHGDSEIAQNFNCGICSQLAHNAMETTCCGQLLCYDCSEDIKNANKGCPYCRKDMVVKESIISRRIISTLKVDCTYCEKKISGKDRIQHQLVCKKRKANCKFCGENMLIEQLIEHIQKMHEEQLLKLLIKNPESQIKVGENPKPDNEVFQNPFKNSEGAMSGFGQTGKYYCGRKCLIGKCGCCDGRCGPTNGENCDSCMELDMKKNNLKKGFLVNPQGQVCKFDSQYSTYFCGCNRGGRICEKNRPCTFCQRTMRSRNLGRYSKLI